MFASSAPILRWSSPEGRGQRTIGRRLNDGHTSPWLDENLKCAEMLGVSQPTVTGMLNMLNLPPDEIERILFETH